MSDAQALLAQLADLGVVLEADGDLLRINAPKGVLDGELKRQLSAQKKALLALIVKPVGMIQPAPKDAVIPLTSGQQRLWVLSELHKDAGIYNVPMAYRLTGDLDIEVLENSLHAIHRRHSILRAFFGSNDDVPHQHIDDTAPLVFEIIDLTDLTNAPQLTAIEAKLEAEVQKPFDLKKAPLWRCALLRLSDADHMLIFTMHHIVFDLSSKTLFLRELERLYGGDTLPELPIEFRDFALAQQSAVQQHRASQHLDYWEAVYTHSASELLLPTDHPRTKASTANGRSLAFSLSEDLSIDLKKFSRATKSSMYMTLLTAFHVLFHRYTGQTDQIICAPVACRNSIEVEPVIGYFNNILPLRANLTGDPTFRDLLVRIRGMTLDAMKHQEAPFQKIAELPNLARVSLANAMFNFRGEDSTLLDLKELLTTPVVSRRTQADFDLALYMGVENGELCGVLDYNADLFDEKTAETFLENFETLLANVLEDPDQQLSSFPALRLQFPKIENALSEHPKVDEAVVVVRSDAIGSNCVAYLVLNEDDVPTQEELRLVVQDQMPANQSPIVFVPLDQIQQLPSGKVDLAALPAPSFSRVSPEYEYVAPRTELEKMLAQIWQRVLWCEQKIGIHDNFFDLGGHSLLSVQLIAETEKELGQPVPLSKIGQLSTIAHFAKTLEKPMESIGAPTNFGLDDDILNQLQSYTSAWNGKRVRPNSLIVGLNTDGYKPPVFWVVQRYLNLSLFGDNLGPAQPIYGLRSGHNVMGYGDDDIKVLAQYYVAEILEIQSDGPFIIGGICQAAEIAFEIALRLLELGKEVDLLVLQERFIAKDYTGNIAFLFGGDSDRNPYYHFAQPELGWSKYYSGSKDVRFINGRHGTYFQQGNIQSLTSEMKAAFENARIKEPRSKGGLVPLQRMNPIAYQAKIAILAGPKIIKDQIQIAVRIHNISPEIWLASESSGLYLGARWINPKAKGAKGHDKYVHSAQARAVIPLDLKPGQDIKLMLDISIPEDHQLTIVNVDLVDEGIIWFSDAGSQSAQFEIERG